MSLAMLMSVVLGPLSLALADRTLPNQILAMQAPAAGPLAAMPDPEIMLHGEDGPPSARDRCRGDDYRARIEGCTEYLHDPTLSPAQRAQALAARAAALVIDNDDASAASDVASALALQSDLPTALVTRATLSLRARRPAAALTDLDRALDLEPARAAVLALRGYAHWSVGLLDDAEADFAAALAQEKFQASAHYGLGLVKTARQQPRAAIAAFTRAVAIDHKHADAYFHRARAHLQAKAWKSALEDFEFAIISRPNFAAAYFQRGRLQHARKRFAKAIEDYTTVISLDPGFAPAYNNRGRVWVLTNQTEKAAADYAKAVSLGDASEELADLIAQLRGHRGVSDVAPVNTAF